MNALKITLQHDETGRMLDWSLDKSIPVGYSIVSNEQGPVFGQWQLPKEWAEDFEMSKEHKENLDRIARLASIGDRWEKDSSLEKWFPITAEKLVKLKARVADLEKQLDQIYDVATGQDQVAFDDTLGMQWIAEYITEQKQIP